MRDFVGNNADIKYIIWQGGWLETRSFASSINGMHFETNITDLSVQRFQICELYREP